MAGSEKSIAGQKSKRLPNVVELVASRTNCLRVLYKLPILVITGFTNSPSFLLREFLGRIGTQRDLGIEWIGEELECGNGEVEYNSAHKVLRFDPLVVEEVADFSRREAQFVVGRTVNDDAAHIDEDTQRITPLSRVLNIGLACWIHPTNHITLSTVSPVHRWEICLVTFHVLGDGSSTTSKYFTLRQNIDHFEALLSGRFMRLKWRKRAVTTLSRNGRRAIRVYFRELGGESGASSPATTPKQRRPQSSPEQPLSASLSLLFRSCFLARRRARLSSASPIHPPALLHFTSPFPPASPSSRSPPTAAILLHQSLV
ncbi:hypothetical protein CC78DRAFT_581155 [Lojkania enalia]|uniref:Uncharacterized protein n=1 Tax=Lojkania enalia TaxID=147567 RepID=A0A9P4K8N1_9PLEO|nr:hypothetical protein CC78DRAFT_581155 [Didymosphaeria enalia]